MKTDNFISINFMFACCRILHMHYSIRHNFFKIRPCIQGRP